MKACEKSKNPLGASRMRTTAVMLVVTGAVTTSNVNVTLPAETARRSGAGPAIVSSLVTSKICRPPAGAGSLNTAVHVTDVPGFGCVDVQLSDEILGNAITVRLADCVVPA